MQVVLAQPRGFCAGVVRAIEIVEAALEIYGPPVYVLHEIVHNARVLRDLSVRGAIFVDELEEVPEGANIVFSAHGVSAARAQAAQEKAGNVIDATCPLVTKVHLEVRRHARAAREVILIGHAGHPEVIGTLGRYHHEYGGSIYLIQTVEDVAKLEVNEPGNLAFVTQTTLSVDDTKQVIAALKERFPNIVGPRKDDICYATQNRQMAVRRLAAEVDVLIVVGACNSSNSNRLREVGEHSGLSAYLVQEAEDIDSNWFASGARVGLTAGASAPEILVEEVLERLSVLGIADVQELDAEPEGVNFPIPSDLVKLRQRTQASKAVAPIG